MLTLIGLGYDPLHIFLSIHVLNFYFSVFNVPKVLFNTHFTRSFILNAIDGSSLSQHDAGTLFYPVLSSSSQMPGNCRSQDIYVNSLLCVQWTG